MSTQAPRAPGLKSGLYHDEPGAYTDVAATFRYLLDNHIRSSLTSPPLLKDIKEGTMVFDRTTNKLWINSNGALLSVQFS